MADNVKQRRLRYCTGIKSSGAEIKTVSGGMVERQGHGCPICHADIHMILRLF